MINPTRPGYWWAKGFTTGAPGGWQMFVVDVNQRDGKLVVRFADALHTEVAPSPDSILPWFRPSRQLWTDWKEAKHP